MKLVILYFAYTILKMSELQNKTVTMELNNLQLETIKCLFGHNDWEMNIIEQLQRKMAGIPMYKTIMIKVRKETTTMLQMMQMKMTIQNLLFHRTPHKRNANIASVGRASQINKKMWWHDRTEASHQRNNKTKK